MHQFGHLFSEIHEPTSERRGNVGGEEEECCGGEGGREEIKSSRKGNRRLNSIAL